VSSGDWTSEVAQERDMSESEETSVKIPEVGDHVIYIDPNSQRRNALVTNVWESFVGDAPGVNCVVVHKDEARVDSFGRQMDRNPTSVVHRSTQPAHGNSWCWPDEL